MSELLHEYMREHKMYDAMNDSQIVERLRYLLFGKEKISETF